ncbi:hypothetical protein RJ641_023439 [Dillenia turbinata]|uniref:Uncharacterized protein n=1 Tax=Dillenia turbinata TaxID=194707 RepID=A0AAN8UGI0_9MAGN
MGESLFDDLPPPSSSSNPEALQEHHGEEEHHSSKPSASKESSSSSAQVPPPPALKSALKRSKPPESLPIANAPGEKKLRFKMTTDASDAQVIDAMQKIASHIKNPTKFAKASKLAIRLIESGAVKSETSDQFFVILEAAMSSSASCNDPSVRGDYHALFEAAQSTVNVLNKKQKNQLATWTIRAMTCNDFFTDDSFVLVRRKALPLQQISSAQNSAPKILRVMAALFSKAAGRIKEAISSLPVATEDDDKEEAVALEYEREKTDTGNQKSQDASAVVALEGKSNEELDPFGLDALLPGTSKREDKTKGKKDFASTVRKEEEEESKRFLKCQTGIDILVKYAYDNVSRFTTRQRDAITKLWASIREQQTRRKQGKSVTGKLDVNAFEWLQQKYAAEKISIRHSVGGSGDRRAQQWLG